MKIIYGIESTSSLSGKRRLNITFYDEYDMAVYAARRIDPALEPEIKEFHLEEKDKSA